MTARPGPARAATMTGALLAAAETEYGVQIYGRDGAMDRRSFRRVLADALRLANGLQRRGFAAGDVVAVVLPTSHEFVRVMFALFLLRIIPFCAATPRLGRMADYKESIAGMARAAGASAILTDASLLAQLAPAAEAGGASRGAIAIQELENAAPGAPPGASEFVDAKPADIALIQFSSGTTVDPKPVALSHANLISNTRAILATFPGKISEHSGCSWLPLHHDMGLIGGLFSAVAAPGDITLLRPEDFIARPVLWLRALSDSRATVCPAPNFALQICVDRIKDEDLAGLDLSHWSIALIGAETVREKSLRRFYERFQRCGFRFESFTPVYGLAEATLAVTFSDPRAAPRSLHADRAALSHGEIRAIAATDAAATPIMSVGRALAGVAVELRDSHGAVLPEGRVGRIFVRGPSVMVGYYRREDLSARALQDGWLDTGDLGFFYDGELYIYGREKDIIILNGRNHDPQSIEFTLDTVPGLQHDRAAAIAVEDERRGTEGFVVLCEKERGKADADGLARAARDAIIAGSGLIPEAVAIIETGRLPRTTSGKVRRAEAARQYRDGELESLALSLR